jgi:anaerobic ribonucleoside-triphosphate reductase activating protein
MKVLDIIQDSIVDGEGLRTVIFFAGCPHHCKGCHNPESWNICNGNDMSLDDLYKAAISNPLNDVTFSGGDPLMQASEVKHLARKLKMVGKNLWCYTGYTYDEIVRLQNPDIMELLSYVDVLVDGRFDLAQRDLTLAFKGSRNQNIINMVS